MAYFIKLKLDINLYKKIIYISEYYKIKDQEMNIA